MAIALRCGAALFLLIGMLGSGAVAPVQAAVIIVPDNYPTIQAAVNASTAGGFIVVRPGTYAEHVSITKALTITGENRATTIVDGGGAGNVFYVNASNVYISGFTVRNGFYGIHYLGSNNGRIQDVLATANTQAGIFLEQSAYNTIENSSVTGSIFGIDLGDVSSHHTTIQQVAAFSNAFGGINGYTGSSDTSISHCSVHDNGRGISIGWTQNWNITGCDIYANGTGIYLDSELSLTVRNSDFHANAEGVRFTGNYAESNLFEWNRFYQNTSAGMSFNNDAHGNIIRLNDFYNNLKGVVILANPNRESYVNTFIQNIFINNGTNAQVAATGYINTWDSGYPGGGNYWGDYTGADIYNGPSQNVAGADGLGDTARVLVPGFSVDRYPLMGLNATNNGPAPVGNPVQFTAFTPIIRQFTYTWTFGDGATGSGANTAHVYATSGPFTATCTASFGDVQLTGSTNVTILYVPHTNADLSNLALSTGALTPAFAPGTTAYTQAVDHDVTSLTVTPTVADATATVTVNGSPVVSGNASSAVTLNVGNNIITTIVTAEDGTTKKTYAVTVTRAGSAIADLSGLVLSTGALTPAFATGTTAYTQAVKNNVASLTVTPSVADATATVTVNGNAVVSGNASGAIALGVGDNVITTLVTAEDGITTKTYTVTVRRDFGVFLPVILR